MQRTSANQLQLVPFRCRSPVAAVPRARSSPPTSQHGRGRISRARALARRRTALPYTKATAPYRPSHAPAAGGFSRVCALARRRTRRCCACPRTRAPAPPSAPPLAPPRPSAARAPSGPAAQGCHRESKEGACTQPLLLHALMHPLQHLLSSAARAQSMDAQLQAHPSFPSTFAGAGSNCSHAFFLAFVLFLRLGKALLHARHIRAREARPPGMDGAQHHCTLSRFSERSLVPCDCGALLSGCNALPSSPVQCTTGFR